MPAIQRIVLWSLLVSIFLIIYHFDKIYLVKIHFYSRTLNPGLYKSYIKQRIQIQEDCDTTIERTKGATLRKKLVFFLSFDLLELLQRSNLSQYQCSSLLQTSGCTERFSDLAMISSPESVLLRSADCLELEMPDETLELEEEELENPLAFSILSHG